MARGAIVMDSCSATRARVGWHRARLIGMAASNRRSFAGANMVAPASRGAAGAHDRHPHGINGIVKLSFQQALV